MSDSYTHIADLVKEAEPPDDGILTGTVLNDDDVKAVIFGFGPNEELSEHLLGHPKLTSLTAERLPWRQTNSFRSCGSTFSKKTMSCLRWPKTC